MNAWAAFNSGLPNVRVDELEIQYSVGKIRAATYGRGLWESPLMLVGVSESASCEEDCITIFPNPTSGKFQLSVIGNELSVKEIKVYNIIGEAIYHLPSRWLSGTEDRRPITIDLSDKPSGIYFLQVKTSDKTYNTKISIE